MLRFLDVPQAVVSTSEGNVGVPILYRQARSVMAVFPVEASRLRALLEDDELEPVTVADGKPVIAIAMFDYQDTSIGPYHEAAVATLVVPRAFGIPFRPALDLLLPFRWRRVGMYILDLPVTTAIANAAGRELWGLPKFVTEIPIEWQAEEFRGAVLAPGSSSPVITLKGELGRGTVLPQKAILLYSRLHGELIATRVDLYGLARHTRSTSLQLEVGAVQHPMAERLAKLGLGGAKPALVQVAPSFRARLHLGHRLRLGEPTQKAA